MSTVKRPIIRSISTMVGRKAYDSVFTRLGLAAYSCILDLRCGYCRSPTHSPASNPSRLPFIITSITIIVILLVISTTTIAETFRLVHKVAGLAHEIVSGQEGSAEELSQPDISTSILTIVTAGEVRLAFKGLSCTFSAENSQKTKHLHLAQ